MTKRNWAVLAALQIALLSAAGVGPAAAAQSITSNLPIMANDYQDVGSDPGVILALNLIRYIPSVLDDQKGMLDSFILLNNCDNAGAMERKLNDEFDYPKIAAFYKAHAAQILAGAPSTITVPINITLGQYDATRSGFPFLSYSKTVYPVPGPDSRKGASFDHAWFDWGGQTCSRSFKSGRGPLRFPGYTGPGGHRYRFAIEFSPVNLDEIPMGEAAARDWIASLSNPLARGCTIRVRIELQHQAPQIVPASNGFGTIVFRGRVVEITVVAGSVGITPDAGETVLAHLKSDGEPVTMGADPGKIEDADSQASNAAQSGTGVNQPSSAPGMNALSATVDSTSSCRPGSSTVGKPVNAVRVGPGILKGLVVQQQPPRYPSGGPMEEVILEATVGTNGLASALCVVQSPSASKSAAAIEALSTARFRPYLLNGKPVAVRGQFSFVF